MTHSEIHNAIRTRFTQQVVVPLSLTTIFDNQTDEDVPEEGIWARLTIKPGSSEQITAGVKRFRNYGIAIAQLFDKVGTGDGDLLELADQIKDAFLSVGAEGIHYQTPDITTVGRDGPYWQVNVTIKFFADHQES